MTTPIRGQLFDLETKLLMQEVRSSSVKLGELLDDDFTEIGASGRTFDKTAIIADLAKEALQIDVRIEDFSVVELSADIVLATYVTVGSPSQSEVRKARRSSIWKRHENSWRIVFHQGTPVP